SRGVDSRLVAVLRNPDRICARIAVEGDARGAAARRRRRRHRAARDAAARAVRNRRAAPAVQALVERERSRQRPLGASAAQHLYPADKGWARVDPAVGYESISLVDLAVLVNDPAELAAMLTRLTDEEPADGGSTVAALEQRYSDVVMLIGALDPRLGRMLYSKLARAVLNLDSDRRRALLRRAILPDLLDGRRDGEVVLGEFPDVDLADALCLLLDLEAAAPELLPVALEDRKSTRLNSS